MESAGTLFGTIWRHVPEENNQNLQRVKYAVLMTVTMKATLEEPCPADGDSKFGGIPVTHCYTLYTFIAVCYIIL
jgi:hypothetical protein